MVTISLKKIVMLSLIFLLSGCIQLRFSQYDKLTELFAEYSTSSVVHHPYLWDVSIGNYQNKLLQVDFSGRHGFTNNVQDAIIFANNRIVAIGPVGPFAQKFRIKEVALSRTKGTSTVFQYTTFTNDVVAFVETCEDWRTVSPHLLRQDCRSDVAYTNQITLDQQGNMIKLSQYLPFYKNRLVMQKVSVTTPAVSRD